MPYVESCHCNSHRVTSPQAIDELFNANQVNLQLMAVTPAVLSLVLVQWVGRTVLAAAKSSSRGRLIESASVVHRDLRTAVRQLERLLSTAQAESTARWQSHPLTATTTAPVPAVATATATTTATASAGAPSPLLTSPVYDLTLSELGLLMSILHRLQNILVLNSSHFDAVSLRQLQEDLRDLTAAPLSVSQRLSLVERMVRSYHFLMPARKSWPMTGPFV